MIEVIRVCMNRASEMQQYVDVTENVTTGESTFIRSMIFSRRARPHARKPYVGEFEFAHEPINVRAPLMLVTSENYERNALISLPYRRVQWATFG